MMRNVVHMMWHRREGDTFYVSGKGLIVRPKIDDIRVQRYKDEYDNLFIQINNLLADE